MEILKEELGISNIGTIDFFGPSFSKMMGDVTDVLFEDLFEIERPKNIKLDFKTGKTIFSNEAKNFSGIKFDKFTNLEDDWYSRVFKEDSHLLEENDQKYKKGKISSHQLEYRMLHEDGRIRWIKDRGIVIEKGNNLRKDSSNKRKNSEIIFQI